MDNRGYPASLEVGKLYPVIPDAEAAKHGYIRVIDESGEGYGYSRRNVFSYCGCPGALAKALSERSGIGARRPLSIRLRNKAHLIARQSL